jgi:hypothetical protein
MPAESLIVIGETYLAVPRQVYDLVQVIGGPDEAHPGKVLVVDAYTGRERWLTDAEVSESRVITPAPDPDDPRGQ